jgi:hypothetical protein
MHQAVKWIIRATIGATALAVPVGAMAQHSQPGSSTSTSTSSMPPGATAPGGGVWPAPVGHRQVRPADLPPDVVKSENRPGQDLRDLDAKMRICKGC